MMNPQFTIERNSAVPIYRQLSGELHRYIKESNMEPGQMLPSIKSLAEANDVSIRTMDLAIAELINAGICYRRPKKGTFVGSGVPAENTKAGTKRRKVIAIHAPNRNALRNDKLFHVITAGLQDEARNESIDLLVLTDDDLVSRLAELQSDKQLDILGITILCTLNFAEIMRLAREYPRLNFIVVNYRYPEIELAPNNLSGVFNDEFAGGYLMTDYLLSLGRRRIGVISSYTPDTVGTNYQERVEGWRAALLERGIMPEDSWVAAASYDPKESYHDLRTLGRVGYEMLRNRMKPDAVFCLNDFFAAGVCDYLRIAGQSTDILVAGHDYYDEEVSRIYGFPTIMVDYQRIGRLAVKQLLQPDKHRSMLVIPPRLKPRPSNSPIFPITVSTAFER